MSFTSLTLEIELLSLLSSGNNNNHFLKIIIIGDDDSKNDKKNKLTIERIWWFIPNQKSFQIKRAEVHLHLIYTTWPTKLKKKKMQVFQRNVQFEWGLHECAHVSVSVNETGAFTRKKKVKFIKKKKKKILIPISKLETLLTDCRCHCFY